jgi:ABC-type uncharacterized transport system auxiliary subunit
MFMVLLLATLPPLLTACGSSGPAKEDSYYRLGVDAPTPTVSHRYPGTVLVSKFDGRGFSTDRAIIFRDDSGQQRIQRYTYHRWAESPGIAIQDLLARYLRDRRVADFVVTPAQRVIANLIITGTLYRFEHHPYETPPKVVVEMELAVVRTDRRQPLFLKRYRAEADASDKQVSQAIPAFDRALGEIFQGFITDFEVAADKLDARKH